ncbi:hypothetical protein ACFLX4_02665 [Chloroflexota bacterium]
MKIIRANIVIYLVLVAAAVTILFIEKLTHIEFMLHLAAIPLEVLVVVFIVEKFLADKENKQKRKQLMYIKSCLFRSEMRHLFFANFSVLKYPTISMQQIKNSNLDELRKMREDANAVEYKSLEEMEPVIMEYVNARSVWQNLMDLAIGYGFDEIVQDMIYILHFIYDVRIFRDRNPNKLFIHEAARNEHLMQKIKTVLGDGIRRFLDYIIELKEKQPDMFYEIISDYELLSQIRD